MIAQRVGSGDPRLDDVLHLIQHSFAYMDGRVDPPSSALKLDAVTIARHAVTGEIWVLSDPIVACVILNPEKDHLYLGKLAVEQGSRGRGFARHLVRHSIQRARALGLRRILLQTRVELVENHAAFRAMGFVRIAQTSHPGFDRPTSLTFACTVE